MRLDGSIVHYQLAREFGTVACDRHARRMLVDYPVLYEGGSDMSGHLVLVPPNARPDEDSGLDSALLVCLSGASAVAAHEAGLPAIRVRGNVPFSRLCNFMQAAFMRFERLEARLRACANTRSSVRELLETCARETGCEFALVDEQYRLICESGQDEAGSDLLEDESIDLFMSSHRYRTMRASKNVFVIPGSSELLMKNVFARKRLRGTLISRHEGDSLNARYTRFVLNFLSGFLEEAYVHAGSFNVDSEGLDRVRVALSRLLANGSASAFEIESLLEEAGHSPESGYIVLRIERSFTHEGSEGLGYLLRRFEAAWPRAHCFVVEGVLFMLADIAPSETSVERDFMKDILVVARDNLTKVGMSRPFTKMNHLDAARAQATAALEQGSLVDPSYWVYHFDDYALSWLVAHGKGDMPALYMAHPAVEVLLQYDEAHESELLHTLSVFARSRYNATKASDELYVARSTLLNRLERVNELTGVDLDDADERLYLALSFAMLD